ncbi:YjgN family protein [Deinococcus pimensis]|uniref:YjgN family protein n=1 Tax=Deinococcus pimensis TaxID=309888 RepID=UPI0004B685E4|nr:YjgN family protein [Deinococcus pimensis]
MDTFPSGAPLQPTSTRTTTKSYPLSFTGSAGEYFRIWIVNLALTVVTLGVYLAWAKVRHRKYMYGNTWLDGHNFDYTADPVAILKGHLVIGAAFVAYSLSGYWRDWLPFVVFAVFGLVWPLLAWQSLRFTARNTRHRGLRFHFHGTRAGAYAAFLGWPLLLVPTLGLLYPFVQFVQTRFLVGGAAYGTARARFEGDPGKPWIIYLTMIAAGTVLGLAAAALVLVFGVGAALSGVDLEELGDVTSIVTAVVSGGALVLIYIAALTGLGAYLKGAFLNFTLESAALPDGGRIVSRMNPWVYAWIAVTNLLAQGLTLGLATPWAAVRRARYVLPLLSVVSERPISDFADEPSAGVSALGEVATDFLGLDLGL